MNEKEKTTERLLENKVAIITGAGNGIVHSTTFYHPPCDLAWHVNILWVVSPSM